MDMVSSTGQALIEELVAHPSSRDVGALSGGGVLFSFGDLPRGDR